MKQLKKIWDMLPEGRPVCVPKPEAWGVKQEEDKERDKDLKKKAVKLKADTEKVAGKAAAVAKDSVDSLKVGSQKVGDAVTETAKDVKGNVEKRFK